MRLEVAGVRTGYGRMPVIKDVSLTAESGELVGILGKNGMGKTTLVRAIMGFLPMSSGSVRMGEHAVERWRAHRIVRLGVAYGAQDGGLFAKLTVEQNLALAAGSRRAALQRLDAYAEDFPILRERLGQRAGSLSGGEQRMLILVRTLLQQPRLIVLDEVSEGMQPRVVDAVARVLRRERETRGTTVLLVEQNRRLALELADRVMVLKGGEVLLNEPNSGPELAAAVEAELAL